MMAAKIFVRNRSAYTGRFESEVWKAKIAYTGSDVWHGIGRLQVEGISMDSIDKLLAQVKAEYGEPAKTEEPKQQPKQQEPFPSSQMASADLERGNGRLPNRSRKSEPTGVDNLLDQLKAEYEEKTRLRQHSDSNSSKLRISGSSNSGSKNRRCYRVGRGNGCRS